MRRGTAIGFAAAIMVAGSVAASTAIAMPIASEGFESMGGTVRHQTAGTDPFTDCTGGYGVGPASGFGVGGSGHVLFTEGIEVVGDEELPRGCAVFSWLPFGEEADGLVEADAPFRVRYRGGDVEQILINDVGDAPTDFDDFTFGKLLGEAFCDLGLCSVGEIAIVIAGSPEKPGWLDNLVLERIPEPASLLLVGSGVAGLGFLGQARRRRRP